MTVFTTTRRLGMPAGPFSAPDLRRTIERAGIRPAAVAGMEQVHGATVRVAGESDAVLPACDALLTRSPGVALAVRSADCVPLVLCAPGGVTGAASDSRSHGEGVAGVAHAGWRGAKARVPASLLEALGVPARGLIAAIGPGIGPCCYEVGPEFDAWFPGRLARRGGRRYLDLPGEIAAQLAEAGVPAGRIHQAPWCTACTPDQLYSFRREGQTAGRMLTCVMLE